MQWANKISKFSAEFPRGKGNMTNRREIWVVGRSWLIEEGMEAQRGTVSRAMQ